MTSERWSRRRIWRGLRRGGRALYRAWELVPVTVAGLAAAGAGWYVFDAVGEAKADFVLRSAGIFLMALVALSVAAVTVGSAGLWLVARRRLPEATDRSVDVGTELQTGFRLPKTHWWPLVGVDLTWEVPREVDVTLVDLPGGRFERVTPRRRGYIDQVARRLRVRGIFGLASCAFTMRAEARLRVAPARGQADLRLVVRYASGEGFSHPAGKQEGELIEMRRYAPGDPLRHVLWKTFARTRRLLVRTPERAIIPQPSTVAYLVAGDEDEATAATARGFLEGGLLGTDYRFAADGARRLVSDRDEAVEQIIGSARHRNDGGHGLGRLLSEVDPVELGNCVLFVPGRRGPWLQLVMGFAGRLPAPPTLVVGVEGAFEQRRRGFWSRLLAAGPAIGDRELRDLPALYDELRKLGGPVQVIHRKTGAVFGEADIAALRMV